jgi:hypothetical protein
MSGQGIKFKNVYEARGAFSERLILSDVKSSNRAPLLHATSKQSEGRTKSEVLLLSFSASGIDDIFIINFVPDFQK